MSFMIAQVPCWRLFCIMESTDKNDKKIAVTEESSNPGQNCEDDGDFSMKTEMLNVEEAPSFSNDKLNNESEVQIQEGGNDSEEGLNGQMNERTSSDVMECASSNEITKEILSEDKTEEPVFDGTEVLEIEEMRRSSNQSGELDSEAQGSVLNDRAVAIKKFVKERSAIAVSTFMRRLSGKKDENEFKAEADKTIGSEYMDCEKTRTDAESNPKEVQQKSVERTVWNPLNFIKIGRDSDTFVTGEALNENVPGLLEIPPLKGRIIIYTKLGCEDCKKIRLFLHRKRLKYVEINIDIFPGRKLELEKNTGSSTVPKVYFNDVLIGGLIELRKMEDSGILDENIDVLFNEESPYFAPLPPLLGEDDESGSGKIDELATIVKKMRESITPKDRFYKMRRFSNCFLGSEAVDFISEDQYLERDEVNQLCCMLKLLFYLSVVTPYNMAFDQHCS